MAHTLCTAAATLTVSAASASRDGGSPARKTPAAPRVILEKVRLHSLTPFTHAHARPQRQTYTAGSPAPYPRTTPHRPSNPSLASSLSPHSPPHIIIVPIAINVRSVPSSVRPQAQRVAMGAVAATTLAVAAPAVLPDQYAPHALAIPQTSE